MSTRLFLKIDRINIIFKLGTGNVLRSITKRQTSPLSRTGLLSRSSKVVEQCESTNSEVPLDKICLMPSSYSEAIDILYSSFSFDLVGLPLAYRFFTLVPPQRLNAIRHLQLVDIEVPVAFRFPVNPPKEKGATGERQWLTVCSALRIMPALQTLKVHIVKRGGPPLQPAQESKMVTELGGVQVRKGNFILQLPGQSSGEDPELRKITQELCQVERGYQIFQVDDASEIQDRMRYGQRPGNWTWRIAEGACHAALGVLCCPCLVILFVVRREKRATRR